MAATPDMLHQGMSGPAPGAPSSPQDATSKLAETSPENPSQYGPENPEHFSTGQVTEEDQQALVTIIGEYRASWAQDRLERIYQWTRNLFYWKGVQLITWIGGAWYDAGAWARSQNQESGEDTDLERWSNPLTLMFCNVFTATMSRAIPEPIVKPRNADPSLKDTVTAKAATEAMRIIKKQNRNRSMVRTIYELLFLMGSYFKYTRPAIDGQRFGYDEVAVFEDMQISTGPHYVCPSCGAETPATDPNEAQGMTCPSCGAWMGQESYYAAGEGNRTSLRQAGVKRIPRAGVKQTLISCLEMDMDPKATGDSPLSKTPIASYDSEIDFGEACRMFPKFRDKIQPGAEVSTTPMASIEKLARLQAISALGAMTGITADTSLTNPTYSLNWVTPNAYYKRRDWAFAERMERMFPEGLLLTMVGEVVVDVRPAVLEKELSHAALYTSQGVYCDALANTAVSFNARFNRVMWILDDWASRAALGLNVADASRLDTEKMSGKPVPAGTIVPLPMKFDGNRVPIGETFAHFELPVNPALWNYPMMLMTFAELILGIPRQLSGNGTQDDVETLGGQQLQLARAATTLKPYFENVKDEDAQATQNAIDCLKALMASGAVKKLTEVIESNGGAFQNNVVDWSAMEGNVEVEADEDQDLPVSPEELRTAINLMFKELTNGNAAAVAWFDVPANQELAQSTMVPGSVVPDEAQRLKTEADIQAIIENGPQMKMLAVANPDGSRSVQPTTELAAHPGKMENFPVAKQIVQRYMLEHYELRTENPVAWQQLIEYWDELSDGDMKAAQEKASRQLQVTKAGQPAPPKPDQGTMAAVQELQKLAVQMADRLGQLAQLDPLLTKQTITGQKDAAKAVVESAMDATKALMGEQ
jgi:hypothetical protein